VNKTNENHKIASCAYGKCRYEREGKAIMAVACYCTSCQQAGQRIAKLPNAPQVISEDGGTYFIMHRKDRLVILQGKEYLKEFKLSSHILLLQGFYFRKL